MKRTVFLCLLLAVTSAALADDWPQWLGTERDGIWREPGVRKNLREEGAKVLWRAPVNWGYAGPAVAKGRVYVPDVVFTDDEFDGKTQGGRPREAVERILCLNAETGEPLWEYEYEVTYTISYPGGPRVTPTVVEDRLYFQGGASELYVAELDLSGNTPRSGQTSVLIEEFPNPVTNLHDFAVSFDGQTFFVSDAGSTDDTRPLRMIRSWTRLVDAGADSR